MFDYYKLVCVNGRTHFRPHIRFRQGVWQIFRSYVTPQSILFPTATGITPCEAYQKFEQYEYH